MTDILLPLFDHLNKDNLENFNNICNIFFREYDKENKGYIDIETLEKSINEIKNHFLHKSFGILKLKILMSLFSNCDKKKSKNINKIIDDITDINIYNIFTLLSNDNKILLEEFKQIVILLLLCLVDTAIENETDKKSNNIPLLSFIEDDESELMNILDSDTDSEFITLNELIETIINDILCNFKEDIINTEDLKKSILNFFKGVVIENKKISVSDDEVDNFFIEYNINDEKFIKKLKIKRLLINFITQILERNNIL
jgi:hypothetical protein